MTIRDFARLCGCNPQTLRYYDHRELLKPIKVDPWSGYRFYDKEQALDFVKIKNLQRAGFTIAEIKKLLEQDQTVICAAFEEKIAQLEEKLQEIRTIQKSYQSEMNQMTQQLQVIREQISRSMQEYDPTEEFGVDRDWYSSLLGRVEKEFELSFQKNLAGETGKALMYDLSEDEETFDFLHDPEYEIVYEKHGWSYVRDFLEEFARLEDGAEYALLFELDKDAACHTAFANTVLGILLERNSGKERTLGCNVHASKDGENHFWLLKRKSV